MGEQKNSDFELEPKPERSEQLPEDGPSEPATDEKSGDQDEQETNPDD